MRLFQIINIPMRSQSLGPGPEWFNNMDAPANVAGNEDPKDYFYNNMHMPENIVGVNGGYGCPVGGPCQDTLTWDK